MQDTIKAVRSYLAREFPGRSVTCPAKDDREEGLQDKLRLDYPATAFHVGGNSHLLYVSDVILGDSTAGEMDTLIRRFNVASELREVGKLPLLLTASGPLLILDWLGPYELTENEILTNAPCRGGVYVLVEPFGTGYWKPYVVNCHEHLNAHLQLFAHGKERSGVCGFNYSVIDDGVPLPHVVRERVAKFLAHVYQIDDPTDSEVLSLAVNLPLNVAPWRNTTRA